MSKFVKYIGTQTRWPELAVTGKQSTWSPGWTDERSDSEAAQLLATGLFFDVDSINQTPTESAALSGLVSAAGNFTVNSRDGLGRATSYTDTANVTYTVTYGSFGPATVSGGGNTRTYAYSAAGLMTGYSAS